MKRLKLIFSALPLLAVVVAASATPVYAVPTLRFILAAPATTIDCADGAACDIDNPEIAGTVIANFSAAGVLVNVTTGVTKPVLGSPELPNMDLNNLTITSSAAADITLLFSDTDFSGITPFSLLFGGTLTAPGGSTVEAIAWSDGAGVGANALFCGGAGDNCGANGVLIGSVGPFGPGAFSGTAGGAASTSTPYSITQAIRLHLTGPATFSGDFELIAVPEPASVALLGGALLVTVGFMRKKLRRS
jgi:hypothetical protein